ncbi:hypothetical protein [Pleionea sp. CnH1-48]|uniref:hypothetical protein n=1 Tax=Pleionea sp. CnH1-48 TaxID=2954494 RepID=UPI00209796EE|nr:hypothetical protein [Pleionea sp. CnH1-48]MCO7224894.1 hypothetical protein [Pleionea sp. CnH1-48]
MMNKLYGVISGIFSVMLLGCDGSISVQQSNDVVNGKLVVDFRQSHHGWHSGFADYPQQNNSDFNLIARHDILPEPLDENKAQMLSGNNLSSSLFMFLTRKVTGLDANSRYDLLFTVTLASNAPQNCVGAGGAPGEDVYIVAGASTQQPKAELVNENGTTMYRMNIDHGQQSMGGSDAIVLGNFANSKDCSQQNFDYELKGLSSTNIQFTADTDANGNLWLLLASDSGFVGTTALYFVEATIEFTKL